MPDQSRQCLSLASFAGELGMSTSTLYRRLHQVGYAPPGRLITPREQDHIRVLLGYPPLTDWNAIDKSPPPLAAAEMI